MQLQNGHQRLHARQPPLPLPAGCQIFNRLPCHKKAFILTGLFRKILGIKAGDMLTVEIFLFWTRNQGARARTPGACGCAGQVLSGSHGLHGFGRAQPADEGRVTQYREYTLKTDTSYQGKTFPQICRYAARFRNNHQKNEISNFYDVQAQGMLFFHFYRHSDGLLYFHRRNI